MALRLVRHSWQVKPLRQAELAQLRSAAAFGGYMCPALRLAAHELEASSMQLCELPFVPAVPNSGAGAAGDPSLLLPAGEAGVPAALADWRLAFVQDCCAQARAGYKNPHALLAPEEELRAMGHLAQRAVQPAPLWKKLGYYEAVEVPACPVSAALVADTEARLRELLVMGTARDDAPPYPLHCGGAAGHVPLAQAMHAELEDRCWALGLLCCCQVDMKHGGATANSLVDLFSPLAAGTRFTVCLCLWMSSQMLMTTSSRHW